MITIAMVFCVLVAIAVFGSITIDMHKNLGAPSQSMILKHGIRSVYNGR